MVLVVFLITLSIYWISIIKLFLLQDLAHHNAASKDVLSSSMPVQIEESVCSFKSKKSNSTADNDAVLPNSNRSAASGLKSDGNCAFGDLLANHKYAGFNLPEHENDVSIFCDIFLVPNCICC